MPLMADAFIYRTLCIKAVNPERQDSINTMAPASKLGSLLMVQKTPSRSRHGSPKPSQHIVTRVSHIHAKIRRQLRPSYFIIIVLE
jgi:hypothetical protein